MDEEMRNRYYTYKTPDGRIIQLHAEPCMVERRRIVAIEPSTGQKAVLHRLGIHAGTEESALSNCFLQFALWYPHLEPHDSSERVGEGGVGEEPA